MTQTPDTNDAIRQTLVQALAELHISQSLLSQAGEAFNRAATAMAAADQLIGQHRLSALPPSDKPDTSHCMANRPGRHPKIEADPELQAIILSRIDRLTYVEIANDIAAHFPPERQVKKSAIHSWWKKRGK